MTDATVFNFEEYDAQTALYAQGDPVTVGTPWQQDAEMAITADDITDAATRLGGWDAEAIAVELGVTLGAVRDVLMAHMGELQKQMAAFAKMGKRKPPPFKENRKERRARERGRSRQPHIAIPRPNYGKTSDR